ncbi:MAG: alpha-mannosidase [Acidimicrobiia bacterium]
MIGNSHIDPVWLWQWPEGYQEIRATFRSALDRMNEYPDFNFTCDSAAYYEWIEEIDSEMFAEIQARVSQGRWEIVGGWWIEPDCNIPSGESFVRQALISQLYFQEKFGRVATVGYNVDPFGHSAMLPQLLQQSGMDNYVFMRPGPNELELPSPIFWWESPDGSRVLAYRLPHLYCSFDEDLSNHLDKSIAELPEDWTEMMAFYGVGNHGGGPTRGNLESIHRLDGLAEMPRLHLSTTNRFFTAIREAGTTLPVRRSDLQHHAVGCYSAHSGIKRWMRRAEGELGAAEAWAAVSQRVTAHPYPRAALAQAWRQVLFNQFHDTLGGTAIQPAYRDARDQLGEANAISGRVHNVAVQSIGRRIDIPASPRAVPIVVFNPHAWPVQSVVELEYSDLTETDGLLDPAGQPVRFQEIKSHSSIPDWRSRITFEAALPPFGYRTYLMTPDTARPASRAVRSTGALLENDRIRMELDEVTGLIVNLVLRENGTDVADLADPGQARARVLDDPSDTWGHGLQAFRDEIGTFQTTSVRIVETGPVRAVLRVVGIYEASRLVEDFVLYSSGDSVEVRVTLDWREQSKLLKLRFPTRLRDVTAAYEIPYGVIERPAQGVEEPGQRWVDITGMLPGLDTTIGLAILNDAKYAFDINGGDPGITAARSPIFAHHEPVIPDPGVMYEFQDQGLQRFSFALLPHRGGWAAAGLTRRGIEFNQQPTALVESSHPGSLPLEASYVSVEPDNLIVGALKLAEDGDDLVIRIAETAGRETAGRVTFPAWGNQLQVQVGPFEICTFRFPRDSELKPIATDFLERATDHKQRHS